jgi:hypothetical protein
MDAREGFIRESVPGHLAAGGDVTRRRPSGRGRPANPKGAFRSPLQICSDAVIHKRLAVRCGSCRLSNSSVPSPFLFSHRSHPKEQLSLSWTDATRKWAAAAGDVSGRPRRDNTH